MILNSANQITNETPRLVKKHKEVQIFNISKTFVNTASAKLKGGIF